MRIRITPPEQPPDPKDDVPKYMDEQWYNVKIESYTRKTSFTKKEYLSWELSVDHYMVHPNYRLFFVTLLPPMHDEIMLRVVEFIAAVTGVTIIGAADVDFDQFIDKKLRVKVKNHRYDEQTLSGVQAFKPYEFDGHGR
jgi:hypothetical protein